MAFDPVQLPNFNNGWNLYDPKYWKGLVGHANLLHASEIKLPTTAWGSAKVIVSETGVVFDFTKLKIFPSYYTREFTVLPGKTGGGINRVIVLDGTIMGRIPETPTITVESNRVYYQLEGLSDGDLVWVKLTLNDDLTYDESAIESGDALPEDDPTEGLYYYQLATVSVDASGAVPKVTVNQTRWGPLSRYTGKFTSPYTMNDEDDEEEHTDFFDLTLTTLGEDNDDTPLASLGYDSAIYKGPRIWLEGTATSTMDSNGDTTDWMVYTLKYFIRELTVTSNGNIVKIGPEILRQTFTFYTQPGPTI